MISRLKEDLSYKALVSYHPYQKEKDALPNLNAQDCSICLENFDDRSKPSLHHDVLNHRDKRMHRVHEGCIKDYLNSSNPQFSCPLCKVQVDADSLRSPAEQMIAREERRVFAWYQKKQLLQIGLVSAGLSVGVLALSHFKKLTYLFWIVGFRLAKNLIKSPPPLSGYVGVGLIVIGRLAQQANIEKTIASMISIICVGSATINMRKEAFVIASGALMGLVAATNGKLTLIKEGLILGALKVSGYEMMLMPFLSMREGLLTSCMELIYNFDSTKGIAQSIIDLGIPKVVSIAIETLMRYDSSWDLGKAFMTLSATAVMLAAATKKENRWATGMGVIQFGAKSAIISAIVEHTLNKDYSPLTNNLTETHMGLLTACVNSILINMSSKTATYIGLSAIFCVWIKQLKDIRTRSGHEAEDDPTRYNTIKSRTFKAIALIVMSNLVLNIPKHTQKMGI